MAVLGRVGGVDDALGEEDPGITRQFVQRVLGVLGGTWRHLFRCAVLAACPCPGLPSGGASAALAPPGRNGAICGRAKFVTGQERWLHGTRDLGHLFYKPTIACTHVVFEMAKRSHTSTQRGTFSRRTAAGLAAGLAASGGILARTQHVLGARPQIAGSAVTGSWRAGPEIPTRRSEVAAADSRGDHLRSGWFGGGWQLAAHGGGAGTRRHCVDPTRATSPTTRSPWCGGDEWPALGGGGFTGLVRPGNKSDAVGLRRCEGRLGRSGAAVNRPGGGGYCRR